MLGCDFGVRMETQTLWAKTLRTLREKNETVLVTAISNLPISFTADTITLTISNPAVRALVEKEKALLPDCLSIKNPRPHHAKMTLTEKMEKLFGDKLITD